MIKRLDLITTLVILLITVLYILEALQFPGGAKIVPTIFGGLAFVVVVIQLLSSRFRAFRALSGELKVDDAKDLEIFRNSAARRRLLLIGASLLAIPLIIAVVGLPLALPLYVAGMLLIKRQRLYIVIVCTALISAASYGLLLQLLAWPWNGGAFLGLLG